MLLTYRGCQYQASSTAYAIVETGMTAKYRNGTYQIQQQAKTADYPVHMLPAYLLKYRGIAYPKIGIVTPAQAGYTQRPAIA